MDKVRPGDRYIRFPEGEAFTVIQRNVGRSPAGGWLGQVIIQVDGKSEYEDIGGARTILEGTRGMVFKEGAFCPMSERPTKDPNVDAVRNLKDIMSIHRPGFVELCSINSSRGKVFIPLEYNAEHDMWWGVLRSLKHNGVTCRRANSVLWKVSYIRTREYTTPKFRYRR
jgi:hypothetical protein